MSMRGSGSWRLLLAYWTVTSILFYSNSSGGKAEMGFSALRWVVLCSSVLSWDEGFSCRHRQKWESGARRVWEHFWDTLQVSSDWSGRFDLICQDHLGPSHYSFPQEKTIPRYSEEKGRIQESYWRKKDYWKTGWEKASSKHQNWISKKRREEGGKGRKQDIHWSHGSGLAVKEED